MAEGPRTETYRWTRDIILSVVLLPAILAWLNVPAPLIILAAILGLITLKAWEKHPHIWALPSGKRKFKMIALGGMIFFGTGFLIAAGIYFWPQIQVAKNAVITETSSIPSGEGLEVIQAPLVLAKNRDGSDRTFISVSPYDLMGFFKKNTSAQAQQLVQPYLGNWIALSGLVYDVHREADDVMIQPGTSPLSIIMSGGDVQMHFRPTEEGNAEASLLIRGSKFKAVCQIQDIQEVGVALGNCRFFT